MPQLYRSPLPSHTTRKRLYDLAGALGFRLVPHVYALDFPVVGSGGEGPPMSTRASFTPDQTYGAFFVTDIDSDTFGLTNQTIKLHSGTRQLTAGDVLSGVFNSLRSADEGYGGQGLIAPIVVRRSDQFRVELTQPGGFQYGAGAVVYGFHARLPDFKQAGASADRLADAVQRDGELFLGALRMLGAGNDGFGVDGDVELQRVNFTAGPADGQTYFARARIGDVDLFPQGLDESAVDNVIFNIEGHLQMTRGARVELRVTTTDAVAATVLAVAGRRFY